MIEFDWDEANISHIARHDVLPQEVEEVLGNDPLELGASVDRGELRITLTGRTQAGRILMVIITYRGSRIRVVTSYPAMRRIRTLIRDGKGAGRMKAFKTPHFESEREEAEWWDSHQEELADAFEEAAATGALRQSTLKDHGVKAFEILASVMEADEKSDHKSAA